MACYDPYPGRTTRVSALGHATPASMSALLDEVRAVVRRRHLSYATEKSYLGWVRRYVHYHARRTGAYAHPRELAEPDVEAFLNHLANDRDVAASTQTQALSALLFLYDAVLGQPLDTMRGLTRVRKPPRLPAVLSQAEVAAVLALVPDVPGLVARLLYGAGLRVSGALRLRVKDLDFDRAQIAVRSGKGDRDRVTVLPTSLAGALRAQVERVALLHRRDLAAGFGDAPLPHAYVRKHPAAARSLGWQFVFPASRVSADPRTGAFHRHHLDPSVVQKAVRAAARRAGIERRVTCHTFRHSFATHLIETGTDVRTVQELLGHAKLATTQVYLHVARLNGLRVPSPLDRLGL